ncbi:MAG: hypothetical protein ACQKBY_11820 [Verrucomicrobiales bacterium]
MKHIAPPMWSCVALLWTSCAQTFMDSQSYTLAEGTKVNGAEVKVGVKPMGGEGGLAVSAMVYMAAKGSLDGPFLWRIEAEGEEGRHEWLRVDEVRVETEKTGRRERFPAAYLGKHALFEKVPGEEGRSFAKYRFPGKLSVKPSQDGVVRVRARVAVQAEGRVARAWVGFTLRPESGKLRETVFLPAEIVRGLRGDPREWDW